MFLLQYIVLIITSQISALIITSQISHFLIHESEAPRPKKCLWRKYQMVKWKNNRLALHLPYFVIRPSAVDFPEMLEQSHRSLLNCLIHSFLANLAPSITLCIKSKLFRQILCCLGLKSLYMSQNRLCWTTNIVPFCPSCTMLRFISTDLKFNRTMISTYGHWRKELPLLGSGARE